MTTKKTLGIVGGMGPLSTADFFYKVVQNTQAQEDAEHIHVIMDSDPAIPDRTEAILNGDNGCIAAICASVKKLAEAGAEVFAMPCNTAHAFFREIAEAAGGGIFLNMVEETVRAAQENSCRTVGLLATDGTLRAQIYQDAFERAGISVLLPSEVGQREVMGVIYDGVKAGKAYDVTLLRRALKEMQEKGAESFILGCTELPLAFTQYALDFPAIDTAEVLARAAVRACGYELN